MSHIYPNDLRQLFQNNHALACVFYDLSDHSTPEAERLNKIIKEGLKTIKRMEFATELNAPY